MPPQTVDECLLCDYLGASVADAQSIILDLEFIRGMWIDMDFFNKLGGWHLVPKVGSSKPRPRVKSRSMLASNRYRFITWEDTVDWTIQYGRENHAYLIEWGANAHQGLSEFGQNVVDGFGQLGDKIQQGSNRAGEYLKE